QARRARSGRARRDPRADRRGTGLAGPAGSPRGHRRPEAPARGSAARLVAARARAREPHPRPRSRARRGRHLSGREPQGAPGRGRGQLARRRARNGDRGRPRGIRRRDGQGRAACGRARPRGSTADVRGRVRPRTPPGGRRTALVSAGGSDRRGRGRPGTDRRPSGRRVTGGGRATGGGRDGTPSARSVALAVIRRVVERGGFSNLALRSALDRSDLSSAELAYGTLRRLPALDREIALRLDRPMDRTSPAALAVLRLGVYQLRHTRIPRHAAVSETVALADARERGLVNAVLRRIAAEPAIALTGTSDAEVSVRTGLVEWAVRELRRLLGPE